MYMKMHVQDSRFQKEDCEGAHGQMNVMSRHEQKQTPSSRANNEIASTLDAGEGEPKPSLTVSHIFLVILEHWRVKQRAQKQHRSEWADKGM